MRINHCMVARKAFDHIYNRKNNCYTLFFAGGEAFFVQNGQKLDNVMPGAGQKIGCLSQLIYWPVQIASFNK